MLDTPWAAWTRKNTWVAWARKNKWQMHGRQTHVGYPLRARFFTCEEVDDLMLDIPVAALSSSEHARDAFLRPKNVLRPVVYRSGFQNTSVSPETPLNIDSAGLLRPQYLSGNTSAGLLEVEAGGLTN